MHLHGSSMGLRMQLGIPIIRPCVGFGAAGSAWQGGCPEGMEAAQATRPNRTLN